MDGPTLPLEFARESRDRRITLVVCEGAPSITTLWAGLDVSDLDTAKQAQAAREGVSTGNIRHSIGWWTPAGNSQHPGAAAITDWAAARHFAGVVWTALKPKFGKVNRIPAEDEVVGHLSRRQGAERDIAEEYVRLAPRQIVTPYRMAIEKALGWTASGLL